ncbi:rh blood group, D antigen [Osmerus eperlanus]|uniref:rh blood group, D antigen n=1 Tax=Osmerus eperlanus TaxID=29151 RepID=UPI002E13A29D
MAPQYAPSLRSRLFPLLICLQTSFIVIFLFCVKYDHHISDDKLLYAEFQDVNVMVVLGFGFLATFLSRYSFSGSGFNLLVAAMAVQWALILNGLESWYHRGQIIINLRSLVIAEMCAASALISIGAVLGKTNPVHLLLIALIEVSGFVLNGWILQTYLRVKPLYCTMLLHIFGAFFGLMMSWVLYSEDSEQQHEKEKIHRRTGLFSLLGTLFLWMFWPSFNSVLVDPNDHQRKLTAVYSTYLALSVSAVTAAGVSVLSSPTGKFNLVHVQSSSLAGGVAVGVSMSAVREPWVAMTIGLAAAMISTLGLRYIRPHLLSAFKCHDTCGVLSVHGLPGILGWLAHLLLQLADSDDLTTAIRCAVFNICTLNVTLSLSMALGVIAGMLLKWNFWRPPQEKKFFDDQAFWEFPHLAVHK